jgi:signal transduction histidine kinase
MKFQTKIAALFFFFLLSIIILFSVTVYYLNIKYAFNDFYKRLELRATLAANSHFEESNFEKSAFNEVRNLYLEELPDEREYFFKIKPNKLYVNKYKELKLPESFFNEVISKGKANFRKNNRFYSGIKYDFKKDKYIVVISADNYYYSHHIAHLRTIFFVAVLISSILAFYISIWFSKRVFVPVKKITQQVNEINTENLHLRLESTVPNDEIGELINTFNNMLDRLETAFETQNNFISNASHELSTPLTSIIGEADVTLNKVRTPSEYIESLSSILNEAEKLEKITKSLLFLARTGFDGKTQKMDKIRIDQILWDVKETIDKLIPKNQVQIDMSLIPESPLKLKIKGNEQLLILAISNIVSNACKYSYNQPVKVSLGATDDKVVVIIKDSGIGIPKEELKNIYDPFFRASNTLNYEGFGIGLPLARNIVRLHNGKINVTSDVNKGTIVELEFPIGDYMLE